MTIVHLEPEEFVQYICTHNATVQCHCIALDNGIAAMIYVCCDGGHLYYMDRIQVSAAMEQRAQSFSKEELHAEVYRKIALDSRAWHTASLLAA